METQIKKLEKICPTLGEKHREVVKAVYESPRISEMIKSKDGYRNLRVTIDTGIKKAMLSSGYSKGDFDNPEEKELLLDEFEEVITGYKWMTLEELKNIIKSGIRGEYNDDQAKQWFNPTNLNFWIKKYEETQRRAAMQKQFQYQQQRAVEIEKEQQKRNYEEAVKENRRRFAEAYKELEKSLQEKINDLSISEADIPESLDPWNFWFRRFDAVGLIDLSNQDRQKIYQEETANYQNHKRLKGEELETEIKKKCMTKVFNRKVAEMMISGTDIEKIIKDYNI